jgi:hypothetical protein
MGANGAPEGDPKLLPVVPPAAKGWHIGNPDVVLEMEEPFEVPATEVLDMQYFILDPKFTEDHWVQAAWDSKFWSITEFFGLEPARQVPLVCSPPVPLNVLGNFVEYLQFILRATWIATSQASFIRWSI